MEHRPLKESRPRCREADDEHEVACFHYEEGMVGQGCRLLFQRASDKVIAVSH